MTAWNLPNLLRGGGTCLVLAAWLPLGGQEPPRGRAGEPSGRVRTQERSAREAGSRGQAPNRGEGDARARAQAPNGSVGEAPNRAQGPSRSMGEAPDRSHGPVRGAGEAGNRPPEVAQPPVRRSIPLPDRPPRPNLGPTLNPGQAQPADRKPGPEPVQPNRPAPAPGGPAGPHTEPARQPNPPAMGGRGPGGPTEARPGAGPRLVHPPRTIVIQPSAGGEIRRDPGGALREVRTPSGAVVHYAPDGQRRVEITRSDGRMLVATPGGRAGYIQRPLRIQGQPYLQRTYVWRGVATARIYRPWSYRGVTYAVYQPCRYYRPGFYLWARRPWSRPVTYRWGWSGQPWFGYYRGWCEPYPVYTSPVLWLTDFMIALTLEEAYQARLDSVAASAPPPPPPAGGLTPEVKQAIAEEVQRQLAQEQGQQQGAGPAVGADPDGPPPLFSSNVSRIFLVHTGVPAQLDGQEILLGEGDVLQLQGAPPAGAALVPVKVLASRNAQLPQGTWVSVSPVDLQEMQNHMQASLDQGLDRLQTQQGQDGLPALPAQQLGTTNAPELAGVQPDADAAGELSRAAQEATESGRVVSQGMTVEEVHRVLGSPRQSATVGGKLIEVFANFKVTYREGRVADVQ